MRFAVIDAPRLICTEGVGVVAGSSSVPSTYTPDTDRQHPQGTVTGIDTLICSSELDQRIFLSATLSGTTTPFTAIPIAIGVTAPPVGI